MNTNCRSLGIVVGDWGVGREVEVSGARVGDASVTREDIRGGIWIRFGSQSIIIIVFTQIKIICNN